jgi:hypothetical protein
MTDRSVIAALLMKSHQRLDAARILCTKGHYEDSINRAYYAMYLAALALLYRKGVEVKTHAGLISAIGSESREDRGTCSRARTGVEPDRRTPRGSGLHDLPGDYAGRGGIGHEQSNGFCHVCRRDLCRRLYERVIFLILPVLLILIAESPSTNASAPESSIPSGQLAGQVQTFLMPPIERADILRRDKIYPLIPMQISFFTVR